MKLVVEYKCCPQQCLIAKWLGLSFTVRVRVRARAKEWGFSVLFFFVSVLKFSDDVTMTKSQYNNLEVAI